MVDEVVVGEGKTERNKVVVEKTTEGRKDFSALSDCFEQNRCQTVGLGDRQALTREVQFALKCSSRPYELRSSRGEAMTLNHKLRPSIDTAAEIRLLKATGRSSNSNVVAQPGQTSRIKARA